ncbi:MAG: capsular polysaccharide biosynthesis protein [Methylococcaceae bacterium]|nr:capsular polysaccharide biosynthesis protein [Methylococcaceae bacterium]
MTSETPHYITLSQTLANIPAVDSLFGNPVRYYRNIADITHCHGIITWEHEINTEKALKIAQKHSLTITRAAEGFIAKLGPGSQEPPASIIIDTIGIYYDASQPSTLESLICSTLSDDQHLRTCNLVNSWRVNRLSKHNHVRDFTSDLPVNYVLVFDQCQDDITVEYGLANGSNFKLMLQAALAENPGSTIILKTDPKSTSATNTGFITTGEFANTSNLVIFKEDVHPVSLIEKAKSIYCVTSPFGFEALLWGKKVRTFGMPFYAGWGLTEDYLPSPSRRQAVALENLVYAVFIAYSRYLDPQTNTQCQIEDLLDWLGLQRRTRERFPSELYACGFNKFKQQFIDGFFQGSKVHYVKHLDRVPSGGTLLLWGNQAIDSFDKSDIKILRLEDGFLRSVGLGAEFRVRPLSWAVDSRSIYFDSTQQSDLESLLQTTEFSEALIRRAKNLRERIVKNNLTKYNVGVSGQTREPNRQNRHNYAKSTVILVPGQVEKDASIKFGAPGIRQNMALLREVRAAHADAYVIYKPHPDVNSGLRHKGDGEEQASQWCDEIITNLAMGELLTEVDEVHVLTSLSGFEALLRGKKVTCYGQPFYAGWGLTNDIVPIARRTRRLSIDELVAGALILYPLYLSFSGNRLISPEQAIDELLNWKAKQAEQKLTYYQKIRRFIHKQIKKK